MINIMEGASDLSLRNILAGKPIYLARESYADGVREGLKHWLAEK